MSVGRGVADADIHLERDPGRGEPSLQLHAEPTILLVLADETDADGAGFEGKAVVDLRRAELRTPPRAARP